MKNSKRTFTLILAILLIVISALPTYGISIRATPRYNNATRLEDSFTVSSGGLAEVIAYYDGYPYTTWATISIKLERLSAFGWEEVENGCLNNTYVAQLSGTSGSVRYTLELEKRGIYRAIVEYSIYGSGGLEPDFITRTLEGEY